MLNFPEIVKEEENETVYNFKDFKYDWWNEFTI
jgi:hypothetical protein